MKKLLLILAVLYISITNYFAQTKVGDYLANKHYFRIEFTESKVELYEVYLLVNHRGKSDIDNNYFRYGEDEYDNSIGVNSSIYIITYGYSGWDDNFPVEFFFYKFPKINFTGYEGDAYFFSKNDYYQFNSDSDSLSVDGFVMGIKLPWYVNFGNGKWFYQPVNLKLNFLFTRWHTRNGDKIIGPSFSIDYYGLANFILPIIGYRFNKNFELYGGLNTYYIRTGGLYGNETIFSGKYPCNCKNSNKELIESADFKAKLNKNENSYLEISELNYFIGLGYRF